MDFLLKKKSVLTLLALFTGGFVPISIVLLSFGYAEYYKAQAIGPKIIRVAHEFGGPYMLYVYIPSMVLLVWIILHSRKNYPDLYRRIVIGLVAGAIATIGLDWVRQMGVITGWLPADTPEMFGKMVTGSSNFNEYYWVGQFIHFMNGANFGLFFVLVFGNYSSYKKTVFWAIVWMLIMELGMMTGPPMGPMVGLFGIRWMWPQLFLLTLIAHIVHGIILGLLTHHWLRTEDNKWLLSYLKSNAT